MKFTYYDTDEDLFQAIEDARKRADDLVTKDQKRYRPGDIVVSDPGYGFPIFHEILDIEKVVKTLLWRRPDDEVEAIDTLDEYREPHMKYFCFARNYSIACPEGELGDFHRSVIQYKIPRNLFEVLRENGFEMGKC